jgi:hypothetical protein
MSGASEASSRNLKECLPEDIQNENNNTHWAKEKGPTGGKNDNNNQNKYRKK